MEVEKESFSSTKRESTVTEGLRLRVRVGFISEETIGDVDGAGVGADATADRGASSGVGVSLADAEADADAEASIGDSKFSTAEGSVATFSP